MEKIGFPLAVKIISEGETAFRKNRLSPSNSPFPKTSDFLGIVRYPRGKPLLEKIGCPPRAPPSRKSLLLFSYSIRLFRFILTIKLLIRIKIHTIHPIQRTQKEKADIKNKNNEVLGKGERERENRFYKIGFPLAEKEGEQILQNRFPSRRKKSKPSKKARERIFLSRARICELLSAHYIRERSGGVSAGNDSEEHSVDESTEPHITCFSRHTS